MAKDAYKNRDQIWTLSQKFWRWLKDGYLRVVVFGPGGTGKTTLGEFLSGDSDAVDDLEYQESITQEDFAVPGNVFGSMLVPPGQKARQERHWSQLFELLQSGRSSGIVNVVSWGYHSFQGIRYQDTKYYNEGMSRKDFLDVYLENRRYREIDVFETLMPRIVDATEELWMITLIAKQDLWWDRRKKVNDWYTNGAYNDIINNIKNKRGHKNFNHEYLSASLVVKNFVDGEDQILDTTVSGYDDRIRSSHLRRLDETITAFVES